MSDHLDSSVLPSYATAHVNRAASLLREESIPAQVGPYRIIELIGHGGMGEVYKAQQESPVHRIVALKLIKLGMDSREVIRRFETERETLAMMSHPNVARIFDAGISETGRPYFAMELVAGQPITQYCDEHQLNIRQRLELFIQVCEAVQHAHTKTIIHRDLKPANMLVTEQDGRSTVKVIDFGVAKAVGQDLSAGATLTQPGQLVGTPQYMSPEQADLAGASIDTRSDIFSLGVVLYELLTGIPPIDASTFASSSYDEIRRVIREVNAPRPSTRLSSLGPEASEIARFRQMPLRALQRTLRSELDWIPLKALRKDPGQRYRTASELADDIHHYLSNRPLIAGPESRTYRLRKFLRRNRSLVSGIAAVLVVLVIGMITTGWMYLRSERLRGVAETNQIRAQSESAKQAAVNQFLVEVLGAANPQRRSASDTAKGRSTTVLEALGEAARKVDAGSLKAQPAVEAAVRITIANTYKTLGDYETASRHVQRAAELSKTAYGLQSPELASSLHLLGMLLFAQGRLTDAESSCREAMEIRRRLHRDTPHREFMQSLNDLSNILQEQGRFADAEQMQRRALELGMKLYGDHSVEIAACLLNLGYMLHRQEKLDESETYTRRALEMHRKLRGDLHPDVSTSLNNLASLRRAQRHYADAEALYQQALDIDSQIFGREHPNVATTLDHLAGLALRQGHFDDAQTLANEAIAIRRKVFGPKHPHVAISLNSLARIQAAQQKLDEAESSSRQALQILTEALGPQHPDVAWQSVNLARIVRDRGDPAGAQRLLREALPILEQKLPSGHPRRTEATNMLQEMTPPDAPTR